MLCQLADNRLIPLRGAQVVAQGEHSLSLTLGSKGLHLTLADRATKEYLWEHLRKMREQAREQAKASRITRASSIDHITSLSSDGRRWGTILLLWSCRGVCCETDVSRGVLLANLCQCERSCFPLC